MTCRPLGALLGLLLVGTLGCDGRGQDDVDAGDAGGVTSLLQAQREDVRGAAHALLLAAEKSLPGATTHSGGSYRGCESAFDDEFTSFRYLAQARIDVDAASDAHPPYVEALQRVLVGAGFTAEDLQELTNGFVSVAGARHGVRASFTHTGSGAFVGLAVAGPCLDVPEDDREKWLLRDEPAPELR